MSLAIGLALMLLASREGPGERIDCRQGFDSLREEAAALPGVNRTTEGGFDIYAALEQTGYVYMLTTPDHYAYPTVVRRRVFTQDGQVMSGLEACGYGPKPPFNKVMREFEAQDAAIKKSFRDKAKD